ncbi:MAG: bifunctional metallophosphatase/5'-nucleotidase [Bacteroidetes bacterium]|jgi:5'-nucleotidase|nr:bifunctional metallophosphatase/5'-nucleotidase [Bacteroidota bacterium]
MISRKKFLKQSVYALAGSVIAPGFADKFTDLIEDPSITILYTNDTHSRIDPYPKNAREFAGLGGIAKRSSLINKIRFEEKNVLLLDAGDVFQGTPWFDQYGGKVDFEMMSEMGYDAMAIGNHEFDLGLEGFADAAKSAEFSFLCANYSTWNTPMHPFVEHELIKEIDGFKVGIFGLGIQLEGIVDPKLHGRVRYRDPVLSAKRSVENFRNFHACDFIICLSHLGYEYDGNQIDDVSLAQEVSGIDLIIGGHTHTFLDNHVAVENQNGSKTLITQMGHSGIRLGRIDLHLNKNSSPPLVTSQYYTIGGNS